MSKIPPASEAEYPRLIAKERVYINLLKRRRAHLIERIRKFTDSGTLAYDEHEAEALSWALRQIDSIHRVEP